MATFYDPLSGALISAPAPEPPGIEALADVDVAVPPSNGQALVWNEASQKWEPGTVIDAEGDPVFGTSTAATITNTDINDWDTAYSWGDHNIDTTTSAPTDGQSLVWDDTSNKWVPSSLADVAVSGSYSDLTDSPVLATVATSGSYNDLTDQPIINNVTVIDDLTDVDTSTVAPIEGQVLTWNSTSNKWSPTSNVVAQTVDTVTVAPVKGKKLGYTDNDKWEPVDTRIQDATDFKLQPGLYPYWATKTIDSTVPNNGDWFPNGSNVLRIKPIDSLGVDYSSVLSTYTSSTPLWYSTDGINWTYKATGAFNYSNLPTWFQFNLSPFVVSSYTGPIYLSFTNPTQLPGTPLQNNDILRWVSAESAFKPVQLSTNVLNTIEYTTALLVPNASADFTINAGDVSQLLSLTTSTPSWVRVYGTAAGRDADTRTAPGGTPPANGSEFYAEIVTTSTPQTIRFSPVPTVLGTAGVAYVRVVNMDTANRAITLDFSILTLEA